MVSGSDARSEDRVPGDARRTALPKARGRRHRLPVRRPVRRPSSAGRSRARRARTRRGRPSRRLRRAGATAAGPRDAGRGRVRNGPRSAGVRSRGRPGPSRRCVILEHRQVGLVQRDVDPPALRAGHVVGVGVVLPSSHLLDERCEIAGSALSFQVLDRSASARIAEHVEQFRLREFAVSHVCPPRIGSAPGPV